MAVLKTSDFSLEIVYENHSAYVSVESENYKGRTQIYCERDEFQKFVKNLSELYSSLKEGKADLREFYEQDYISFESDGLGHFIISGEFNDWGRWNLSFSEVTDQSYLKSFIKQLFEEAKA